MKVRQYRLAYGITQVQMADQLGISAKQYRGKEKGEYPFTIDEMRKCYKVFTKYNEKIDAGKFFLES